MRYAILIFATMFVVISSSNAQAGSITIDDLTEGQITIIHDSNFEFGVTSNTVVFSAGVGGSTSVLGEFGSITGSYFVNNGGTPDPGSGIIYIVDPGTDVVSDIITASWNTIVQAGFDQATITIEVQSSPEGGNLGPLPVGFTGIEEQDGFFSIAGLFADPNTGAPVSIPSNLGLNFGSNQPVPEPASIALWTVLALGMVGYGRYRTRRRKD